MKKAGKRDRMEQAALSFLEYVLLVVLVIAAAVSGMTFLGSSESRPNNSAAPGAGGHGQRVALSGVHVRRVPRDRHGGSRAARIVLPTSIAGRIES